MIINSWTFAKLIIETYLQKKNPGVYALRDFFNINQTIFTNGQGEEK